MSTKFSLTKGKPMFVVDVLLIPVFILLTYSGLELYAADSVFNHEEWEFWAHFHVITAILSIVTGYFHIKAHWNWYKGLLKNGLGKKSKITVLISVLFVILIVTGLMLVFFIDGGDSAVGTWHFILSLVMVVLLIIHTIKRFPLMLKGLRKKRKNEKQSGKVFTKEAA